MTRQEILPLEINNNSISAMIYIVRNQKVMLDFELAQIYGYETRAFNQQVKNNLNKFDDDFRFQLTKEEFNEILMSKNLTSSWGGIRKLPFAFTEQGIYMLMTVLKGELATKQSKILIRTFKQMKDYITDNKTILLPNDPIKLVTLINKNSIRLDKVEEKLELLLDNFIDTTYKHYLILDGEKIEADIAYQSIYKLAKSSVFVIDDYIDIKTLQLLKACNPAVHLIIFSDNKGRNNINRNFIDDFISDTGFTLSFKQNNGRFHDRYIIVDYNTTTEKIFHCGASSKDAGKRITTITKIEETELYDDLIKQLLSHNDLNII